MKQPLVSVCMPVFNDEKSIRMSVESILNQNYQNTEIIISDNGSTDNTYEILMEYAKNDKRINLSQNEENLGWQGNSNKVLKNATGKYIITQHGDDYYVRNDYIDSVIKIFEENPSVGIIHFVPILDAITHYDNVGVIDKMNYLESITKLTYTPPPTVTAYRNKALQETNYYSGDYWNCEVRLSLDLIIAGWDAYFVGDASFFKRNIGATKDSVLTHRKIERLAHLYALFVDLKNAEGIPFSQKDFEKNIIKEYLILKYTPNLNEFLNYIETVRNVIIEENIVSDYCVNLLKQY